MRISIPPAAAVVLALGCSNVAAPANVLDPGVWGGDRMMLVVTRDSVSAGWDCAAGWLDAPITLDAAGRFQVDGRFQQQAGPVFPPVPARYVGVVAPDAAAITLTLTVSPPTQNAYILGPYHLVRGEVVNFFFCA